MRRLEQNAQILVVTWLRRFRPDVLFTSPAGAGESMGSNWHQRINKGRRIKDMGYNPGTPDLLIFEVRAPYYSLMVEMKAPKGVISPVQREFIGRLEARGYRVVIARGAQEAIDAITAYLEGHHGN